MKKILLAGMALLLLLGGTACSYDNPGAEEIGLYYNEGSLDGQVFVECVKPGASTQVSDLFEDSDAIYRIPASLRTWNIGPVDGNDSKTPVTVAAAPEEGQPSGVQVNIWTQTAFTINTFCGSDENDVNSPAVKFWEKVGRRYWVADTSENKDQWWANMLRATIVPALEAASRTVARQYKADVLVSGTGNAEVQQKIADALQPELVRLTGGEYFCKPTFDRTQAKQDCGKVEVLLKDVDYTNPEIQAARDQKQKAIELAAAAVAEANGKLQAAQAQAELYRNPAWIELEKAKIQLEQVKACAANPNCTIVVGANGVITTK